MTTTVPTLFRELPLPQRMRLAAEVLDEANKRNRRGSMCQWDVDRLRVMANLLEREEAEKDERDRIVEEIAQEIFSFWAPGFDTKGEHGSQKFFREQIRAMLERHPYIAEGWTKVTDDE